MGTTLKLQVKDDGPGISANQNSNGSSSNGMGLANTRARLRQLYGSNHRFELGNASDRGLVVTIEIPFNPSANHVHAKMEEVQWK